MPPTLLRPLAFGELLDGAFTLYRRHFLTFFVTSLITILAINVLMVPAMVDMAAFDPEDPAMSLSFLGLWPIAVAASLVVWAALTRQAACAIEGREPSLGDGYRHGLRAFLPLLGAGILIFLLGVAILIPASLLLGLVGGMLALAGGGTGLVIFGSVLLFYAVTLGALAMLFAVPAAVVVERQGPWSAIKRSWSLAAGDRWRVAGIFVVATLLVVLPSIALFAMAAASGMVGVSPAGTPDAEWIWIQSFANVLIGSLTYPFWVVALTLLYFDRRVRTEAYDLERATEDLTAAP